MKKGGFAPDVLQAAVYFIHHGKRFPEALETSIEFAGAWNYCPVLVGAIGGARWGREAISDALLDNFSLKDQVKKTAFRLAETWLDF